MYIYVCMYVYMYIYMYYVTSVYPWCPIMLKVSNKSLK